MQADPSGRIVQLIPTALNVSIEGAPPTDTVALYLDKLPME